MNLRIKKLDKFIAKQFLLLFAGTFFICLFVLMMQFLWRFIDELIGKGLSMEVLAQFFEYMALMMVPQALPLAILLSSLITFGNLGESSELTAIKAAGISLMQSFRSLIVITVAIMAVSFYFQNNIGPNANMKLMQLLVSMKQKSPELEIPEGIFYDGLPNCNIYVQKKNIAQTCALPTALNPVPFCECKGTAIISIHQTIVQLFYSFDIIKHIIDITSR